MNVKFCGTGFLINNSDYNQFFGNRNNQDGFDHAWGMALGRFFKDVIFYSDYKLNDDESNKTLIYYPLKRKSYILNSNEINYFKSKYFPNFNLTERSPEFFSFQIPFPEIYYFQENSKMKHDDMYDISIGRYNSQTYKNIENYTLRLNTRSKTDFESIFQKNFSSVYKLAEDYKEYLKLMMDIEPSNINTNDLIKPYYTLHQNELKKIIEIENALNDEMHEEAMRDSEDKMGEKYSKWFDSELDELNRQAFENDPENYWNID